MELTLGFLLLAAAVLLGLYFCHKTVGRSLHLECHW